MEKAEEKSITTSEQRYSPRQTAEVRKNAVSEAIEAHRALRDKSGDRLNLRDTEAVRERIDSFLEVCQETATIPSVLAFCTYAGLGRPWFYEFCRKNPQHPSVSELENLKTLCASCRVSATDRGGTSDGLTIFLLKNSSLGFVDHLEIEASSSNPLDNLDTAETARARLLASMEDDFDE